MENIQNNEEIKKMGCVIKDPLVLRLVTNMVIGMGNTPIEWNHIIKKAKEGKKALLNNGVLEYQEVKDTLPDTDAEVYLSYNTIHL